MVINPKLQAFKRRAIREKHGFDIENPNEVFDKTLEFDRKIVDLENKDSKAIYVCGELLLNLDEGILKYKNNIAIPITPQNREIKFLEILMQKKGRVVEYLEIARVMDSNCYNDGVSNTDTSLRREVQLVKKILVKKLKRAGMTVKKINNMIDPLTKSGYKFLCK